MTPAKKLILSGLNYPNGVINGSFENGLTDWGSATSGTLEASTAKSKLGNSSIRFVLANQYGTAYQNIIFPTGHKIYVGTWAYLVSGSVSSKIIGIVYDYNSTANGLNLAPAILDASWRYISGFKTVVNNGIKFAVGRASNQTAEFYIDGAVAVDVTALGLEDKTLEWVDTNILPNIGW